MVNLFIDTMWPILGKTIFSSPRRWFFQILGLKNRFLPKSAQNIIKQFSYTKCQNLSTVKITESFCKKYNSLQFFNNSIIQTLGWLHNENLHHGCQRHFSFLSHAPSIWLQNFKKMYGYNFFSIGLSKNLKFYLDLKSTYRKSCKKYIKMLLTKS